MMTQHNLPKILAQMQIDIKILKQRHLQLISIGDWLSYKSFLVFFDYSKTQAAEILNSGEIVFARIGRRKFIKLSSLIEFIEKNSSLKSSQKK